MKLNRFIILSQEVTSASPTVSPSSIPNFFFSLFPENIKIDWSRILAIATPILIAVLVLVALCCCLPIILNILSFIFYGLWFTCRAVVMGLWNTCRAVLCCCGRSTVRMMKAPGAGGALIARATFEAAPKAYFSALRAGTLVLR